jgi:ATP-dependent DNA helicase RecG
VRADEPTRAVALADLHGVGPRRAADLARVGLHTVDDLLHRFPIRYEDRRQLRPLASLSPGETAASAGRVTRATLRRTRRPGFTLFELQLRDESGIARALWFNQRFLRDVFRVGQQVVLYGKVEATSEGPQFTNPQYEILEDPSRHEGPSEHAMPEQRVPLDHAQVSLHYGRIVPIYERIGTLTPRVQRTLVAQALDRWSPAGSETFTDLLGARLRLPDLREAVRFAHYPPDSCDVDELNRFRTPAQVRLILEEFFTYQLGLALRRRASGAHVKPHRVVVDDRVRKAVRAILPFRLTPGQKQSTAQIVEDLQRPQPMNRLLQGDVGAGKTIVALMSAMVVLENGLQVALMAPTEVLAEQHTAVMIRLLAPTRFRVALLTGSTPAATRHDTLRATAAGAVHLLVGTHALLEEPVEFPALGLVIVDEQHRFGVLQRSRLREKGERPDVLVMTATPIPRTLALTAHGDLDVSVIPDRPPGRRPVKTTVRPESSRDDAYAFVRRELERGRQAYVIFPLVEESAKIDLRAATEMADTIQQQLLPGFRIGLLHGRLGADAKAQVMRAFARGDIDVLVSTTVVEVGVDVPNATVMAVEHAERFGLAQLHQLRGRVGRGVHDSFCILLYQSPLSDDGRERLRILAETEDGFVIAEKDLELRGPGDVFGTRQAGLPTFRVGDLVRDRDLMQQAHDLAREWMEGADDLASIRKQVDEVWRRRFGLVAVG